jgi:outer membrane protein assembly factor BamB
MRKLAPYAVAFVMALTTLISNAADWPQWRGPGRDGVLADYAWPALPEKLAENWKLEVGEGHSSPILAGGKIFSFARQGDQEFVRAVDPATGKALWAQSYPAAYTMNPAAVGHAKGPKSTPVWSNGRLYTFGISGILSCWDAASGALVWRKEFGQDYPATSPLYGTAMSPGVFDGLLIVHVGGHDNGALLALDAASGAVKWSWKGDGPGYASPIIVGTGAVRQIVTQTQKFVAGFSLRTGALAWKIPYTTEYDQNAVTPLVVNDLLIVSGVANGVAAYRLPAGGNSEPQRVWHVDDASFYMSTPVAKGGTLYGFSHRNKGQYVALDAATGKILWRGGPRQGENAALLLAGTNLVLLDNTGRLTVAPADAAAFKPARQFEVAQSETWAHPLLLPGGVVVKDKTSLTYWAWK